MSRFRKLSHTVWLCQYHIVWVAKYRFRILADRVGGEVDRCIRAFTEHQKGEVIELNVQVDHIHSSGGNGPRYLVFNTTTLGQPVSKIGALMGSKHGYWWPSASFICSESSQRSIAALPKRHCLPSFCPGMRPSCTSLYSVDLGIFK